MSRSSSFGPFVVQQYRGLGSNVLSRHEVSWRGRRWFAMHSAMCDIDSRSPSVTHYKLHFGRVSIWIRRWADGRSDADLKWFNRGRP